MAILKAPPTRTDFPTVDTGTYIGGIESIKVEDYTEKPDIYSKTGHYQLIFRWRLEGVESEDGQPITIPQYVKLTTGTELYTSGARKGRLPWLTEITRAIGVEDLSEGDELDPDTWVGKRAKLSVVATLKDNRTKNSITSASVAPARPKKAKPAPVIVEEDTDTESEEPF